jgi:murein L,D-transpeptidase YcbB/YkuD
LKREIHLRIRDPFDVFIEYFSVEADETGRLTFFVDVYERDKPLLSILEEQRKSNRAKPAI